MLIISNYHYIREDFSSKYPSIFGLTPKEFRRQLEELAKYGEFISQEELVEFRNRPFNRNYFLITFDDGLREQYELAKPILDEMGIPAIFFINTSNFEEQKVSLVHKIHLLRSEIAPGDLLQEIRKSQYSNLSTKEKALAITHYNYDDEETAVLKYLLNFKMRPKEQEDFVEPLFSGVFDEKKVVSGLYFGEEMLQELHHSNALGSHAHTHVPLGQLKHEEVSNELQKTQEFFRSKFGKESVSISYPYGSLEACTGIAQAVEKEGFQLGFTMERAANASLREDSLLLSRYDCNDLPGGKNDLFNGKDPFKISLTRKWHFDENRTVNQ